MTTSERGPVVGTTREIRRPAEADNDAISPRVRSYREEEEEEEGGGRRKDGGGERRAE